MDTEIAKDQHPITLQLPHQVSVSFGNLLIGGLAFSVPLIPRGFEHASFFLYILGLVALFLAECANVLAKDYYAFRRHGSKDGRQISDWIKPEVLVLKGSWGSLLVAFLFVLLISQNLGWSGWKVVALAVAGFFTGYYAHSDPFYWNQRFFGKAFSALSYTWIPFLSSCLIFKIDFNLLFLLLIASMWITSVLWKMKVDRRLPLRYSSKDFPAYRFMPGKSPHPQRDPQGHSFGHVEAPALKTQPDYWRKTDAYLYGVDLFNAEYYWEAHEAWESLWKVLDPTSDHALFLQGLIQVAAASLKYKMNNKEGVVRLFQQATEKLMKIQKTYTEPYMGVDLNKLMPQVMKAFGSIQYVKEGDTFPKFRPVVLRLQK